jgi:hypothetical protein
VLAAQGYPAADAWKAKDRVDHPEDIAGFVMGHHLAVMVCRKTTGDLRSDYCPEETRKPAEEGHRLGPPYLRRLAPCETLYVAAPTKVAEKIVRVVLGAEEPLAAFPVFGAHTAHARRFLL